MRTDFIRRFPVAMLLTTGFALGVARCAATNYTWNGGSGDWSVAANWTPNGVPGAVDAATISSGTATVSTDTTVSNLNFGGGVIDGAAILTIVSNLTWTVGTMSGTGTTRLAAGASSTWSSGALKALESNRRFENAGTILWEDGLFGLGNSGACTLSNVAGAVLEITGNVDLAFCNNTATFDNNGTVRRTTGTGTMNIGVPVCGDGIFVFNNRGVVEVQSGTLVVIAWNGTAQDSGGFVVSPGATLQFAGNGTQNVSGTMNIAGTLSVVGSSVNVTSNLFAPALTVSGGSLTVQGETVIANSTNSGGTLTCNGVATMTNLTLNGGTIAGTNLLTIVSNLNWTVGTMSGPGTTRLLAGASSTWSSGALKALESNRRFENAGTILWENGLFGLGNSGACTLSNVAGAVLEITGNVDLAFCNNTATFDNNGTVRRTTGTGTMNIGVPVCGDGIFVFNNRGVVEVQSGTLVVIAWNGTAQDSGGFVVSPGATLQFAGNGTQNVSGTMNIAGTLSVVGSSVNVTSNLFAPALTVSGGSLTVQGETVIANSTNSGGTLTCNGVATLTNLTLNGGTIAGTNLLTIVSNLNWTVGTMSGTGTTRLAAGAVSTWSSGGMKLLNNDRRFENAGAILWQNGTLGLGNSGTCTLSNLAGGVIDITAENVISDSCANTAVIDNNGLLRRSAGSGIVSLGHRDCGLGGNSLLNNRGVIEVQSGTLRFLATYTQTAGATILSGGNLISSSTMQIQGGTLSGTGTITGNVTSSGNVNPGASPGLLTINGNYTQTAAGALNIEVAGTTPGTAFDQLAVTGTADIAGTLNATLTNGFYPATNAMFTFLTSASRSGTFATFNYPSIDVGMQVNYTATNATIQVINVRPVIPPISGQTHDELVLFSLAVNATDDDLPAQTLTYALTNSPTGASINSSGVISWTPTEAQGPMTTNITVRVTDSGTPNLTVSRTFQIVVNEINVAPVQTLPTNQAFDEQTLFTANATAADSDIPANSLTFELVSGPSGLTVSTNGAIAWTPDESQGSNTFTVTVRVTDLNTNAVNAQQLSTTNSFMLTVNEVNRPPVLTVPGTQTFDELTLLTLTNTATDPDLPANALSFTLVSGPTGVVVNASSGVLTWTPSEFQGPGTNVIQVKVTDSNPSAVNATSLSTTGSFTVIIREVNVAPVLTLPADQTISELTFYTNNASATDSDLPVNPLTFALVSGPTGVVVNASSGAITWTPSEFQGPSTNVIQVSVTDTNQFAVNQKELSTTNTFTITVNEVNLPPSLTVPANQTLTEETPLAVSATATDPDLPANGLTFSLVSPPSGMTIHPASGAISWTPDEAQGSNTYVIKVSVTDTNPQAINEKNLSVTNMFTVIVNESNRPPVLTVPSDQVLDEQTPLSVMATATDPDVPANSLTFALVSGPGGLTVSPAGAIDWTPTEDQGPNSYTVKVKVTDNNPLAVNEQQLSVTNMFMVTVNESNRPPVLGALSNYMVNAGQTISFTATATDPDLPANALTFSLISPPAGATINGGSGLFNWRAPVALAGTTNTVQVRVTDDGAPNESGTNSFTVAINPIGPVLLTPISYSSGQFTVSVVGPVGPDYILQRSTNLIDWTNLDTITPGSVPFDYADFNAGAYVQHFYRALLAP